MEERRHPSFADAELDANCAKLAVARNLQRLYGDVLDAPIPKDLQLLIDRLEAATGGRCTDDALNGRPPRRPTPSR